MHVGYGRTTIWHHTGSKEVMLSILEPDIVAGREVQEYLQAARTYSDMSNGERILRVRVHDAAAWIEHVIKTMTSISPETKQVRYHLQKSSRNGSFLLSDSPVSHYGSRSWSFTIVDPSTVKMTFWEPD
jgi:regulator of extracellular matrix RemA (YlzA/DUF370 family)